jgi:hypothetical protein
MFGWRLLYIGSSSDRGQRLERAGGGWALDRQAEDEDLLWERRRAGQRGKAGSPKLDVLWESVAELLPCDAWMSASMPRDGTV